MTGLAPKTLSIFETISALSCIEPYVLVGGTCMALQVNHRLSEDLDFCKWVPVSHASYGIAWQTIEGELRSKFKDVKPNQLSFDQIDFQVNGVKVTFFNEVGFQVPAFTPKLYGNVKVASLQLVAGMKVKTLFERNTYRDYYDVYVLLKDGHIALEELISTSIAYHPKLNKQMILNRLSRWERVNQEHGFSQLSPKYDISLQEMGEFIKGIIPPSS